MVSRLVPQVCSLPGRRNRGTPRELELHYGVADTTMRSATASVDDLTNLFLKA